MIRLDLTNSQINDLVSILGAASVLFGEEAEKNEIASVFKAMFKSWSEESMNFAEEIIKQHNEQRKGTAS